MKILQLEIIAQVEEVTGSYRTKVSAERSEVTEEAEKLIVSYVNRRLTWSEKFCS